MVTFMLMFGFGGFFGILGGIRYLKALVKFRDRKKMQRQYTEKELEMIDLDCESKLAKGKKIIADWQSEMVRRPEEAQREIRIIELKMDKIQEKHDKTRKVMVEQMQGKGGPSIRSVAYWAGGGVALGFFIGSWMTSMVSHT